MFRTVATVCWPVEWRELGDMQEFAARYCARRFAADLGDRARIASHELLENAVRYATIGNDILYEIRERETAFEIRVTNEAVESRIALLRKRVAEINEPDAADAYRRALRRLFSEGADGSIPPAGSSASPTTMGLGLFRVRIEADAVVSLEVQGRRVTVSALGDSGWVPGKPGARGAMPGDRGKR